VKNHKTVCNKSNRPRKSRKRWAAYASAASAALVSAQSGTVEGAIVDIAPVSFGLVASSTNLDGAEGFDVLFSASVNPLGQFAFIQLFDGGEQVPMSTTFAGGSGGGSGFSAASGNRSGSGSSFANSGFLVNNTATFGLVLDGGNNAWIQVRLNAGALNEFTGWDILNGAYEDSGAPIHVGTNAIPEPSTLALLGLAAAGGVASLRRNRKRQTA